MKAKIQLEIGMRAHAIGNLDAARLCYEKVLEIQPKNFVANGWLGTIEAQRKNFPRARFLLETALEGRNDPEFLLNYANLLQETGSYQQALALYLELVTKRRNQFLLSSLAACHNALKNPDEGLRCADQALLLDLNYAEAWNNRGVALSDLQRYEEALASYERSIELKPTYAEVWSNRGIALNKLKRFQEALNCQQRALELKPNFAEAWFNRGNTLSTLQHNEEALVHYQRVLEIEPKHAGAWLNQGNALRALQRHEEALASYERSLELNSDNLEIWSNRGNALRDLSRPRLALASYERALKINPDSAEVWSNRGVALNDLRRHEEALACHERAIELAPSFAGGYLNKAGTQLRLGNFEEGWQLYEWRWKDDQQASHKRDFKAPLWLGTEPIDGKIIFLHAEQGFGDTIQFCRYAKMVKSLGAKVIIEVQSSLLKVVESLEGVDLVIKSGDPLPQFDYQCPLLSLPLAFKTNITSIPAEIPYLRADSSKQLEWSNLIRLDTKKPSIGIVWAGNSKQKNNDNRSMPFDLIKNILSDKFNWFCLQRDVTDTERLMLETFKIHDYTAMFKDFADTAALISQLDLIISVDTSVAHLAGALGKPIWVLLAYVPDFRWMWDRADCPWYSTMRLFRQPRPADWDSVLLNVSRDLHLLSPM